MAIKTFTTGEVLTSSDTNTYLANSGLVYVTTKTFTTTSSAQQINNCFTSTYDNYRIIFAGIGSTAGNDFVNAQLVDGTSPVSTGIYYHSYAYSGTSAMTTGFQASQAQWRVGLIGDTATLFTWDLFNPQAAAKTVGTSSYMSSATNDFFNGNNGQMVNNTTQYEGIYFFPGSGTWSGTITVYGYRKQ